MKSIIRIPVEFCVLPFVLHCSLALLALSVTCTFTLLPSWAQSLGEVRLLEIVFLSFDWILLHMELLPHWISRLVHAGWVVVLVQTKNTTETIFIVLNQENLGYFDMASHFSVSS